ncbi:Uu.00g109170.m01.CDS01 [Anthostomella pinea]|uniref:Uu.00g109170.m01.CDS01 n=1 Tax=Anthostomella pinea TaxID=933095 RepID=A0AAI8YG22_9PEZI|nr:Uu.00g109170.m01.CDS01 [Anthostomella pinea]
MPAPAPEMPTFTPSTLVQEVIGTQQPVLPRQVVLTQTITYADSTATALVTLDGVGPTAAPAPAVHGSAASDGLTQQQIGIIVGTLIGAVVVGLVIWMFCVARRRRQAYIDAYFEGWSESSITSSMIADILPPRRSYWPPFPRSIPPPVVPNYRARVPSPRWTANDVGRRATTTYVYGEG